MLTVDHLVTLFQPFCEARGVSESRLSTLLFNDGKRIGLLRAGGDITSRKLVDAIQWFSDNWPAGAVWPDEIPRPSPSVPPPPGDEGHRVAPAPPAAAPAGGASFDSEAMR